MTDRCMEDVEWEYPLVSDAPEAAGIFSIKEYIQIRRATISAQVVCRTICELCTVVERIPGYSRLMRCWDQDVGREEE